MMLIMTDHISKHCISLKQMHEMIVGNFRDDDTFEVRRSDVGGIGVFSKRLVREGERFSAMSLGDGFDGDEFGGYLWELNNGLKNVVLAGIGFLANGSCHAFEDLDIGKKVNGYEVHRCNVFLDDENMRYEVIRDIPSGSEVFLDYGNDYFGLKR